jgi:hypothetical protein
LTLVIALWKFGSPPRLQFPKWELTWECEDSYFLAFSGAWNVTLRIHTWPAPSQALALVTSPRLGLWQLSHHFNAIEFWSQLVHRSTKIWPTPFG